MANRGLSLLVQRAAHGQPTAVEDVGVDHCGLDVLVTEEFLDSADVIAGHRRLTPPAAYTVGRAGIHCTTLRRGGKASGHLSLWFGEAVFGSPGYWPEGDEPPESRQRRALFGQGAG